jgi:hypothetical protein
VLHAVDEVRPEKVNLAVERDLREAPQRLRREGPLPALLVLAVQFERSTARSVFTSPTAPLERRGGFFDDAEHAPFPSPKATPHAKSGNSASVVADQ